MNREELERLMLELLLSHRTQSPRALNIIRYVLDTFTPPGVQE